MKIVSDSERFRGQFSQGFQPQVSQFSGLPSCSPRHSSPAGLNQILQCPQPKPRFFSPVGLISGYHIIFKLKNIYIYGILFTINIASLEG